MPCVLATFMATWLAAHGYGPVQQAAVLQTSAEESHCRPEVVSAARDHGLFQLNGPRWRAYAAYARQLGRAWTDPEAQLIFMDAEWRARRQSRAFFATTSREHDRWLFCRHYEVRAC